MRLVVVGFGAVFGHCGCVSLVPLTAAAPCSLALLTLIHPRARPLLPLPQMVVNLTADHRTVYGAHAAEFLQTLKAVIESPDQLVF